MNKRIKRLTSCVLSVIIAGSCAASGFAADVKYGDVDKNGLINSSDALVVLTATVGAKTLTAEETKCGDVDGNGIINSSDALDILLYSVGSLKKFKVEDSDKPTVPEKGDDILALYSDAVKKARKEIPSYRLKMVTETKDPKVEISSILPIPGKDDIIKSTEEEMLTSDKYQTFYAQKDPDGLADFVAECRLKDSSKLKSIKAAALDNGNFKIDIKFKDETKPKASGAICTALGLADYDTMAAELAEQSNVEDIQLNVQINEFAYKNCYISCEINPATNEFVSLELNADMYISTSVPLGLATLTTIVTEAATNTYWDFAY